MKIRTKLNQIELNTESTQNQKTVEPITNPLESLHENALHIQVSS